MSEPPAFFLSDAEMREAAPEIYLGHIRNYTALMTEMFDRGCTVKEVATFLRDKKGVRPPTYADSYERYIHNDGHPMIREQQLVLIAGMVAYVRRKYYRPQGAAQPGITPAEMKWLQAYRNARLEHAWLCRAEGEKFREIGERLGITREQVRQNVLKFGRRVSRALRYMKVSHG